MLIFKKWVWVLIISLITFSGFTANYNYGEALQKAIYFYECQQAGPLPSWNRVEWRDDATMADSVLGGWYDAGDHVKFNLPMSYTASMLGWARYEYKSAFQNSNQLENLDNNLKFVLDYLAACWNGTTYVYQIGDGDADHSWWGPVEVIHKKANPGKRPSYSASSNLSCVMGQTAAALAIGYKLYGNSTYLSKAKSLFAKANADRSDANYTAANNFYKSWSGWKDEILWAAIWLYIATDDSSYLTIAENMVPLLNRQGQTSDIEYQWAHAWDDSHYGGLLMLAKLTGKQIYKDFIHQHLDWWVSGGKGKTPKGLSWIDSWGSLRYATTEAFLAFVYADWSGADTAKAAAYRTFAETQVKYALGDNERNGSYVVGFGTNPPKRPHHRTSHGSWADSQKVPASHRHVLYGALVGGPDQSGGYTDDISNYTTNEVACDYNAGFIGALAKMYSLYGGTPLTGFPAKETKDDEFFAEACINSSGTNYTEIKVLCNNRSGWPARLIKNLGFRYYMDLSEVFAAGKTLSDLTVKTNYVEFPVTISSFTKLTGNIYYIQITFNDGTSIFPGGQSEYSGEIQFRISAPDGTSYWNPANDYSYKDLIATTMTKTAYIPVYDGNTKLYGIEPNSPDTLQVTSTLSAATLTYPATNFTITLKNTGTVSADYYFPTGGFTVDSVNGTLAIGAQKLINASIGLDDYITGKSTTIMQALSISGAGTTYSDTLSIIAVQSSTILLGDANNDGTVNIIDALVIAQYSVGMNVQINLEAADVNKDGITDIIDALRIAQYSVGAIPSL